MDYRKSLLKKGFLSLIILFALVPELSAQARISRQIEIIHGAITAKGANWKAADTPLLRLASIQRRAMLGALDLNEASCAVLKGSEGQSKRLRSSSATPALPSRFDWRDYNDKDWTTPIRDQGKKRCGWAFGVLAAVESRLKIWADDASLSPDLAEQYLISFSHAGSSKGGYGYKALDWIKNHGVPDEDCCPYFADSGTRCDACLDIDQRLVSIDDWYWVGGDWESASPEEIKVGLLHGPVCTYIDVYTDFFAYVGGIYEHSWGPKEGGHLVAIVGWDDTSTPSCWIVKNSWGAEWGEGGYFRIRMAAGECNIEKQTSCPISYKSSECDYTETLLEQTFLGGGVKQEGWSGDDEVWPYSLPFAFPFYGQYHTAVRICSNGFLDFASDDMEYADSYLNNSGSLMDKVRIAPLWTDMTMDYGGGIFIHHPSSSSNQVDQVRVRWGSSEYLDRGPINVEAILYKDGRIRFNYGIGNSSIYNGFDSPPTIGISGGDGTHYCISVYDGLRDLNYRESLLYTPPPVVIEKNLYLMNQTLSSGHHEAESAIIAYPNVSIAQGARVSFKAGSLILADDSFIIEEDANVTFTAPVITVRNDFIIKRGAKVTITATGSITLGPNVYIEEGAEVVLEARETIRFLPELTAELGCRLKATIVMEGQPIPGKAL